MEGSLMAYHGNVLVITEENPELQQGQGTNPSNREQTNPLDAHGDAQTKAAESQPKPPAQ